MRQNQGASLAYDHRHSILDVPHDGKVPCLHCGDKVRWYGTFLAVCPRCRRGGGW